MSSGIETMIDLVGDYEVDEELVTKPATKIENGD